MASSRHHRPGLTLVEMILVLAIILIAVALAVPVVQSMLSDSRVNASADAVRGKLAETRARAMDDGIPWKLAVIANTGVYQLAPEDSPEWQNVSTQPRETLEFLRDELPKDVVFAKTHDDILNSQGGTAGGTGWETVAVYMPDGSARDDTTTYLGKTGMAPYRVNVRALTGAVTVEVFTTTQAGK